MTTIDPAAEAAREAARGTGGQFGEQQHSAPETELRATPSHEFVLSELSDIYNSDSYMAEEKAKILRMESFIADARSAVPTAVSAAFRWDYPHDSSPRLTFDYYLDEHGNAVEAEDGEFPNITDFHFDHARHERQFGFVESGEGDGATIVFEDFAVHTEEEARAELSAARALRHREHEQELRTLLVSAMNGDDAVSAERIDRLTGYDLEQVEAIFQDALRSTANYLRHS